MLFDTFGFPLEITQEVAAERFVDVDLAGFQLAMQSQRALSQAAAVSVDVTADSVLAALADEVGESEFLGYGTLSALSRVLTILVDGKPASAAHAGQIVELILDRSPFYAESGGQVGDHGMLVSENGSTLVRVMDTQKAGGGRLLVHRGQVMGSGTLEVESVVKSSVDPLLRRRVRRAHAHARHSAHASCRRAATIQPLTSCRLR